MTKSTQALQIPDPRTQPTLPVWPDTAALVGLSKASTYEAVKRGEIPSLTFGRRIVVPTAALLRMLGLESFASPLPTAGGAGPPLTDEQRDRLAPGQVPA